MCEYCDGKRRKIGDFDGETYCEVRPEKYFAEPAALFMFKHTYCIAGYGIHNCPMCGRELRGDAE